MSEEPSVRDSRAGADPVRSATSDRIVERLVTFARTLRADGATVPADASLAAAEALVIVGLADRREVRAATKATLVANRPDIESFERYFPTFWSGLRRELVDAGVDEPDSELGTERPLATDRCALPEGRAEGDHDEEPDSPRRLPSVRSRITDAADDSDGTARDRSAYSPAGKSARVDVSAGSGGGCELDDRDLRAFTSALATLPGRRWESNPGTRPDVRRTLRRSVATGGTVATVPSRRRSVSKPSYCLIVDVSRSVLDTVNREFLLALLAGLHRENRSTRSFFFDTGVREVTDAFERSGDPAEALNTAEVTWGGGTRIGRSLRDVRQNHADTVDRRTIVIVLSDGFDVGDLELLEGEMARLQRQAAGVLWLNPLAGTDGYEPTCRGMRRALPYVDGLFEISASADLRNIGEQIERRGLDGQIGYRYD
jgi:uncharacterized protein